MTAIEVTVIDRASSEDQKRAIATRLTGALVALPHDRAPTAGTRWIVIARALRGAAEKPVAVPDYGAWHAHLAGTRRWDPMMTANPVPGVTAP